MSWCAAARRRDPSLNLNRGSAIADKRPRMTKTTNNSIKVKPALSALVVVMPVISLDQIVGAENSQHH